MASLPVPEREALQFPEKMNVKLAQFLIVATLGLSATLCHAAPPTAASIETLLEVTKAKALIEQMPAMVEPSMRAAMQVEVGEQQLSDEKKQAMEKFQKQFIEIMRDELSWERLKPMYLQLYAETLTQEEIDGQIAFYRTPAGAAVINKMPLLMMKSQALMTARIGPLIQRMKAAVKEACDCAEQPAAQAKQ